MVTTRVLLEAGVSIAEKFGEEELVRSYQQLAAVEPEVVPLLLLPEEQDHLHPLQALVQSIQGRSLAPWAQA